MNLTDSVETLKGIGPKTAKKIVDEFGEDTFDTYLPLTMNCYYDYAE